MRLLPFIDLGAAGQPPAPDRRLLRRNGAAGAGGARRRRVDSRPRRHPARAAWARAISGALFERLETPGPGLLLDGLEGLDSGARARAAARRQPRDVLAADRHALPAGRLGAILFFEDLGERPYRVDRLLTHLDLAGVFGAASAVVAGDFSGCREPEATRADSPTAEEVLVERLGRLPIPVALGGAFGHGTRNRALPYGTMCELDTLAGTLTALEGAVS